MKIIDFSQKLHISIIYQKLHNLVSHPVFGPYFDPLIPPPFSSSILSAAGKWAKMRKDLQDFDFWQDSIGWRLWMQKLGVKKLKTWEWKSSVRVKFNLGDENSLVSPPFPPPVFFSLFSSCVLLESFTSWLLISSRVSRGTKKNRRRVVFPVLGTLRTTCARVVNPRFICIIFACAMLCPGQMVKKKRSWFVFHVSDLSPTPSFFKPTADKWLDANCWLPSVQKSSHHPKCSLKQGFLAATFFSKRWKIRVFFVFVCDNLFLKKNKNQGVFWGGFLVTKLRGLGSNSKPTFWLKCLPLVGKP